jgi:serine-type D-Ala-D-Ala carboxypeptidase/endopeptidase
MKRMVIALLVITLACGSGWLQAKATEAGKEEIQRVLQERIGKDRPGIGIVVGIIDAQGSRVIASGEADEKHRPVDGETVFEIGSMTKVFNALLLADLVERKLVKLDDPIARYLPAKVKVPDWNGRPITLVDLATHTSGLPSLPGNLLPKDPANPYADYTVDQLYEYLGSCTLVSEPGTKYAYSNLGAGLLGHIIALQGGADWESLVKSRVLQPLGMLSTSVHLTPQTSARLTAGHDGNGARVPNWDLPTLAGAGALHSDVDDLLKFLSANLNPGADGLGPAMKLTQGRQRETGMAGLTIGLGWHIKDSSGDDLIWHNGQTGGYHSFFGLYPKQRRAVVILINMAKDIDDVGFHLLDDRLPLSQPAVARERTETKVPRETLQTYVGQYQLAPGAVFIIRPEGDRLTAALTGQGTAEIFPESEREFFYKVVDAQISFQVDAQGQVTGLVLHQNGRDMPAQKTSSEVPALRAEVRVDPAILDRYVGTYELAPGFQLVMTKEDDQLMTQATGQPKFPLFAESQTTFFLKVVEASVTFVVDPASGKVTGLVLHQNGDHPANKVQ